MQSHIVIVGFGSIAQGVVPLLKRQFPGWRIVAFDRCVGADHADTAYRCGIMLQQCHLTSSNYQDVLQAWVRGGDILLNLATDVSSYDLIRFAGSVRALYLDTNIEPWESEQPVDRPLSNRQLRERVLALQSQCVGAPTAIVAHGANPGFISILVKRALRDMAHKVGCKMPFDDATATRGEWAQLSAALGIRTIQVSENDTQRATALFSSDVFVNTWSVSGFVTECRQAVEIGWGTHEGQLPDGARYHGDDETTILLKSGGVDTWVESWSPTRGPFAAMVLTHNESLSIADYLSVVDASVAAGGVGYRPSVYYAYRPSDATLASLPLLAGGIASFKPHVMKAEVDAGRDELGVLLISDTHPSFWLGSGLSISDARERAPYNNATSLQVTSSIVAALVWATQHPNAGIVESEALPYDVLYDATAPYWQPIYSAFTPWPHSSDADAARRLTFDTLRRVPLTHNGVVTPTQ